jgi:hypothetical protein
MWSLAWGQQILHGQLPDFDVGPTPHPLANALGIVVAPFDRTAESIVLVLGFLSAGLLIYATCRVGYAAFGTATAAASGALLLTLPALLTTTTGAYVDVPYASLVVLAVALEVRRPARGVLTFVVLGVAGLLRPEAWLLTAAYWLWMVRGFSGRRSFMIATAIAAAAPLIWIGSDFLATGNPLFSLRHTTEATALTGRETGASAVADLPVFTSNVVGRLLCVAALVGCAAALRSPRGRLVVAWLAATAAASAAPVLAGTPLNERYFLATFALLCVVAAYGAFGWLEHASRIAVVIGLASALALVAQIAINVHKVIDRRDAQAGAFARRDAAKAILTDGAIPCEPLVMPAQRVRMLAAVWTHTPLTDVRDAHDYQGLGVYLSGTESAMRDVVTLPGRAGTAASPPSDATPVRASDGWDLLERC